MQKAGIVISIEKNIAKVEIQKHSSCTNCSGCKLGDDNSLLEAEVYNEVGAKIGQLVYIDMESKQVLTAAFIMYVIPLFSLIAGIIGASIVLNVIGVTDNVDIYSAIVGFLFMVSTFIIIRLKDKKFRNSGKYLPIITEIVNDGEGPY
ncbi:MAG: SoxR reducing system RseC family protein [Alkaliphilus sp.]